MWGSSSPRAEGWGGWLADAGMWEQERAEDSPGWGHPLVEGRSRKPGWGRGACHLWALALEVLPLTHGTDTECLRPPLLGPPILALVGPPTCDGPRE